MIKDLFAVVGLLCVAKELYQRGLITLAANKVRGWFSKS